MDPTNGALIERLYAALGRRDGEAMAACYAPDATFRDPVFGDLKGPEVGAMWKMLTARAPDLKIELVEHDASASEGSARWIAHYTFSQTGHPVVNDVQATFGFADGLIVSHNDRFPFYKWARHARDPGEAARVDAATTTGCPPPGARRAARSHAAAGRRRASPRAARRRATAA